MKFAKLKGKEILRTFISIDIPENIQKEILKIQKRLPDFKGQGRLTGLENLHLTLKFLGGVDSEILIEIKRRLKEIRIGAFETEIKSIGIFDNGGSKKYSRKIIVWLYLTNCQELQKIIDEKLEGLFKEEKRFMSHLTIARLKYLKNKNRFLGEVKKIKISNLKFTVDRFSLQKSELFPEGSVYTDIKTYFLD